MQRGNIVGFVFGQGEGALVLRSTGRVGCHWIHGKGGEGGAGGMSGSGEDWDVLGWSSR